jgi:hypothetical protein
MIRSGIAVLSPMERKGSIMPRYKAIDQACRRQTHIMNRHQTALCQTHRQQTVELGACHRFEVGWHALNNVKGVECRQGTPRPSEYLRACHPSKKGRRRRYQTALLYHLVWRPFVVARSANGYHRHQTDSRR